MKSQRPAALAGMVTIMAVGIRRRHAGLMARLLTRAGTGARRRHAKVGSVPPVQPQPILEPLTPAAIFLVVTIDEGGEATVHDALPEISGLVRAIGFREPPKRLSAIASIGSEAWDRLFSGPRPAELHPFIELKGPRHTAPATAGDLLFHIRAESLDVCFELADRILKAMAGAVTVVDERRRLVGNAPDRVDVSLRVQRQRLAILGQVDGQLRHPQDRVVDPDESVGDPLSRTRVPHRQPPADAEVSVQPRVEPRAPIGLERHHAPACDDPVRMLLDPQVRAIGVCADDAERPVGAVRIPRDQ